MFSSSDIVPVLMFHSIGLENSSWKYSNLSEPVKDFDDKISALISYGFTFIFWKDLFEHMSGHKKLPSKSIMLTFDDGYLDNWVYAYPILKKYDAKATIYVTPEFVDPGIKLRPNAETDHTILSNTPDENCFGFLNWPEMREMERSGLIDIQSHALTHTWYFSSPEIVDFHKPGSIEYPWVAWNACPEYKPDYMQKGYDDIIPFGTPIYEFTKSLTCKQYYPPTTIKNVLESFVLENGNEGFFEIPDWKEKLAALHAELMQKYVDEGTYESQEKYESRVFNELTESKRIIEYHLDKKVDFICWPGGAYNEKVLSLAKAAGYKSWTLGSSDKSSFRNTFSSAPHKVKRIGPFHQYMWKRKPLSPAGYRYFMARVNEHRGSTVQGILAKSMLFFAILKSKLSRFCNRIGVSCIFG